MSLNVTGGDFPVEKSGVTRVISSDQRRSNASRFLACHLVDIFDEHYSFSDFSDFLLEAVPHFARETWKGPQSCLGREMKADIRSGASFLTP